MGRTRGDLRPPLLPVTGRTVSDLERRTAVLLGTTMFSLTPDWRSGADLTTLLGRLAAAGCGPAIEVVGHQAWRGFPVVSADDERAFRDTVDRLGLVPNALGVYADIFRRPGRPMGDDEALADIRPQLAVRSEERRVGK